MSNRRTLPIRTLSITAVLLAAFAAFSPTLWNDTVGTYRELEALCVRALETLSSHVPLFPWIVVLVPLLVGALALASVIRQLLATQRLISALLEQEVVPIPEPLGGVAGAVGLESRIRLIDSPDFYAFCFGWLRPEVCISTVVIRQLSASELEAVFRHESWHVLRRDPLRLLVANALSFALFFMPLARDLARHYALGRELRADGATVRAMKNRQPLAGALYRAATGRAAVPSLELAVGAFNALDARIDQLLGEGALAFRPRPLSAFVSVAVLLALSLFLCVSVMAVQASNIGGACTPC